MTSKELVEYYLGRKLTKREVKKYSFYWTKVFMNPHDLAKQISKA